MTSAALLKFDRSRARRADGQPVYADAIDVAHRLAPEAPVFCFSPSALMASAHRFLSGFPGETAFAVKSNDSPLVLKTLARAGITVWDVASVQEMAKVRTVASDAAEDRILDILVTPAREMDFAVGETARPADGATIRL